LLKITEKTFGYFKEFDWLIFSPMNDLLPFIIFQSIAKTSFLLKSPKMKELFYRAAVMLDK